MLAQLFSRGGTLCMGNRLHDSKPSTFLGPKITGLELLRFIGGSAQPLDLPNLRFIGGSAQPLKYQALLNKLPNGTGDNLKTISSIGKLKEYI